MELGTTLQSIINAELSQQALWICHKNRLIKIYRLLGIIKIPYTQQSVANLKLTSKMSGVVGIV